MAKHFFVAATIFFIFFPCCFGMEKEDRLQKIVSLKKKTANDNFRNKKTSNKKPTIKTNTQLLKTIQKKQPDLWKYIIECAGYKQIGKKLIALSSPQSNDCLKEYDFAFLHEPQNLNNLQTLNIPFALSDSETQFCNQFGTDQNTLLLYAQLNSSLGVRTTFAFDTKIINIDPKHIFFDGTNDNRFALACYNNCKKQRCSSFILKKYNKAYWYHKKIRMWYYDACFMDKIPCQFKLDGNVTAMALHKKTNHFVLCTKKENKNSIHIYNLQKYKFIGWIKKMVATGDLPCILKKICMLTPWTYLALSLDGKMFVIGIEKNGIICREQKIYHEIYEKKTSKTKNVPYKIETIAVNPVWPFLVVFTVNDGTLFYANLKNRKKGKIPFVRLADNKIENNYQLWFYGTRIGYLKDHPTDDRLKKLYTHTIKYGTVSGS